MRMLLKMRISSIQVSSIQVSRIRVSKILTILLFFMCFEANAGHLSGKMKGYLKDMTGASNYSKPFAYKSQAAGYYSAGSFVSRNAIQQKNLMNIQLPSYSSGCGGINLFNGGFGFISGSELSGLLKSIMQNAGTYAFQLAIETMSPVIAEKMEELQSWVQKANAMNINSCETATTLVGGLWASDSTASETICSTIGNGVGSDYVKTRHNCRQDRGGSISKLEDNAEYKKIKFTNINLAWEALGKSGITGSDRKLKQMLMTLSGTLIITDKQSGVKRKGGMKEGSSNVKYLPSKITDAEFMNTLFYGDGSVSYYLCGQSPEEAEDKCLNVNDGELETDETEGFRDKIYNMLIKIKDKLILGVEELDDEEISLIARTKSFPLLKVLKVMSQYGGGEAIFEMHTYSDPIAAAILNEYLGDLMNQVEAASFHLVGGQEEVKNFREGIASAKIELRRREDKNRAEQVSLYRLINTMQRVETIMGNQFGDEFSNSLSMWEVS